MQRYCMCICVPHLFKVNQLIFYIDIDECELGISRCQQLCTNTEGNYTCDCRPGFRLDMDDNYTCIGNYNSYVYIHKQFSYTSIYIQIYKFVDFIQFIVSFLKLIHKLASACPICKHTYVQIIVRLRNTGIYTIHKLKAL